jgi:hypothetical protein
VRGFDSVISIGGQSLLDAVLRLVSPTLGAVPRQLPIAVPGFSSGTVVIRSLVPGQFDRRGRLPVTVRLDVIGEVSLSGVGSLGDIPLNLGDTRFDLPIADLVRAIRIPAHGVTISQLDITVPQAPAPPLQLSVTSPPSNVTVGEVTPELTNPTLSHLTATLGLATGSISVPVPTPVLISVDITRTRPIEATVLFEFSQPARAPDASTSLDDATGFGLVVALSAPSVTLSRWLPDERDLESQLATHLRAAVSLLAPDLHSDMLDRILRGVRASAPRLATSLKLHLYEAVKSALSGAIGPIAARTGRLVFPLVLPPAPTDAPCDVAVLPSTAKARITIGDAGDIALQVGFAREAIADNADWPAFTPRAGLDVQVDIAFSLLAPLLRCVIEAMPNFAFRRAPLISVTQQGLLISWDQDSVTLDVWPVVLRGDLTLGIDGPAASSSKKAVISGTFRSYGFEHDDDLISIDVYFEKVVSLELTNMAAISNLSWIRDDGITDVRVNSHRLTNNLTFGALATGGPFSPLAPFAAAVPVINALIAQHLKRLLDTVLNPARGLISPPAVPSALFDAIGPLVPRTLEIDDLTVRGVLATPSTPWGGLLVGGLARGHEPAEGPYFSMTHL